MIFKSTQLKRAATPVACLTPGKHCHFNPRSPRGLRLIVDVVDCENTHFNPRSPNGLRQPRRTVKARHFKFQSTQPKRAATVNVLIPMKNVTFQSTQPEWAATYLNRPAEKALCDFNPRSPSGLRLCFLTLRVCNVNISIHAARVGCDSRNITQVEVKTNFNPRSPNGLRLEPKKNAKLLCRFQSTQPEWAATFLPSWFSSIYAYFNPRSPNGLRLLSGGAIPDIPELFQSTQPEWAATKITRHNAQIAFNFNPRSPNGLRPNETTRAATALIFQSTQPEWAATREFSLRVF